MLYIHWQHHRIFIVLLWITVTGQEFQNWTYRFSLKDKFNNFWRHDRPSQQMLSSAISLAVRSNFCNIKLSHACTIMFLMEGEITQFTQWVRIITFRDLRAEILCGISLIQLLLMSSIRIEGPQSQTSSGTTYRERHAQKIKSNFVQRKITKW